MDGHRCRAVFAHVFPFPAVSASLVRRSLISSLLFAGPVVPAAASVVSYDFDDGAGGFLNAPAALAPHLAAGAWKDNDNTLKATAGNPGKAATASHFDDGNAFNFTLSVDPGFQLDLSEYRFDHRISTTGPIRWSLLINDAEVATGGTLVDNFANADGGIDVTRLTGDVTVDLFADQAGTKSGTWRIDNFALQGTVSPQPAPLPASLLLLASGLLFVPRACRGA